MKKNKAQKDLFYISISTFVVVALWIGFNIHHAYVNSTIEPDLQIQIEAIEPEFNRETLQKLKSRKRVNPVYELGTATSSSEVSQTPSAQAPAPTSTIEQLQTPPAQSPISEQ